MVAFCASSSCIWKIDPQPFMRSTHNTSWSPFDLASINNYKMIPVCSRHLGISETFCTEILIWFYTEVSISIYNCSFVRTLLPVMKDSKKYFSLVFHKKIHLNWLILVAPSCFRIQILSNYFHCFTIFLSSKEDSIKGHRFRTWAELEFVVFMSAWLSSRFGLVVCLGLLRYIGKISLFQPGYFPGRRFVFLLLEAVTVR